MLRNGEYEKDESTKHAKVFPCFDLLWVFH